MPPAASAFSIAPRRYGRLRNRPCNRRPRYLCFGLALNPSAPSTFTAPLLPLRNRQRLAAHPWRTHRRCRGSPLVDKDGLPRPIHRSWSARSRARRKTGQPQPVVVLYRAQDMRARHAIPGNHCIVLLQTDFTSPPSMRSVEPVIQRAAGETRKAISSAISSGSPYRAMPASFGKFAAHPRRSSCAAVPSARDREHRRPVITVPATRC